MTKEATGWTSGNWSGYAGSTGGAGSATSVEGYWEVPSVSKTSKNTYSSTWLGIDGFGNSDLIQTGVEQAWVGGAAQYTAWWEILPASQTNIPSLVVHPGDVMFAYIAKQTGSTWEIELEDTTTGKSFVTDQTYTGVADTVEWIVEAPTVGGSVSTLATYSTMYFDKDAFNGFYAAFTTANRGVMIQGASTCRRRPSRTRTRTASRSRTAPGRHPRPRADHRLPAVRGLTNASRPRRADRHRTAAVPRGVSPSTTG